MKCFFHLCDGRDELLDATGVDVADADEARTEALEALAELRSDRSYEARDWSGWKLRAVDVAGTELFVARLSKDGSTAH